MERKRVTASKLHLAILCQHPWTSGLPWVDKPSASGRLGNAFHAMAERQVLGQPVDPVSVALEFSLQPAQVGRLQRMWAHWLAWAGSLNTSSWVVEQPMAYDPTTGNARTIHAKRARDYSAASDVEICGTADVVDTARAHEGEVAVGDYKTGRWVDDPQDSQQMWLLSLAASRIYDVDIVRAQILRVNDEGLHVISHTFFRDDFANIEETLSDLHYRMTMPVGPNPGLAQCKYCPVRDTCTEAVGKEKTNAVA